ncbi:MAG: hypothetical protein JWR10_1578 [Rubritepida sp.]|nr:hypothetical protein [Rubritepida sp.]
MSGLSEPRTIGGILRRMLITWVVLLALLGSTVVLAYVPLQGLNTAISIGIAGVKTVLVLWFFMELRRPDPLLRLAGAASLLWIGFLFGLVFFEIAWRVN